MSLVSTAREKRVTLNDEGAALTADVTAGYYIGEQSS